MERLLAILVAFFATVLLLWFAFGISAIIFSFLAIFVAKAGKFSANISNPFAGLIATLLFCTAVTSVLIIGSAFMHIFMQLFINLPQSEEIFTRNLVDACVNFGKDLSISIFLGILAFRWNGGRLYMIATPIAYLISNALTFLYFDIDSRNISFIFNSHIEHWLSAKLTFLRHSFDTIIDFDNWLAFFKSEIVRTGGNLLVFEPVFAFVLLITGFLSSIFSKNKIELDPEPENFNFILKCSIGTGALFLISAGMFFWAPGYLSSGPSNILLGLLVIVLQIIAFPTFLVSFLAFVGFSLILFLPPKLMKEI